MEKDAGLLVVKLTDGNYLRTLENAIQFGKPVLLENVAGLMAPLQRDATCIVLPLAQVGLTGSSRFDPALLHDAHDT